MRKHELMQLDRRALLAAGGVVMLGAIAHPVRVDTGAGDITREEDWFGPCRRHDRRVVGEARSPGHVLVPPS